MEDEEHARMGAKDAAHRSELCNAILAVIGGWKKDCELLAQTADEQLIIGVAAEAMNESEADIRKQLAEEGVGILDKKDGSPSLQGYIAFHVESTAAAKATADEAAAELEKTVHRVEEQVRSAEVPRPADTGWGGFIRPAESPGVTKGKPPLRHQ